MQDECSRNYPIFITDVPSSIKITISIRIPTSRIYGIMIIYIDNIC
jgi:hypothetical protein